MVSWLKTEKPVLMRSYKNYTITSILIYLKSILGIVKWSKTNYCMKKTETTIRQKSEHWIELKVQCVNVTFINKVSFTSQGVTKGLKTYVEPFN